MVRYGVHGPRRMAGPVRSFAMARRGRGWCFLLVATAALGAAPGGARAGDVGFLRWDTDLKITSQMLDSRDGAGQRVPPPDYSLAVRARSGAWGTPPGGLDLFEFTPGLPGSGTQPVTIRPQFALGASSDTLRTLLRVAGLDASRCSAPVMRMHSAFAGSAAHANVSFSAHCSVH